MIFQVWVYFSRVKTVPTLAVDVILYAIDSESRTWRKVGMIFMRQLRYINTACKLYSSTYLFLYLADTMTSPAEVAHGPMFIGLIFNLTLFGAMIVQTYFYFKGYKKDRLWMKLYVVALLVANTVSTVFLAVYLYNVLVQHFDDVLYLNEANWVFATEPSMTGIIAAMVQGFFAWRVKVLTSSIWSSILVAIPTTLSLVASIGTAVSIKMYPNFADFQKFKYWVAIWLICAVVADVFITMILVLYLKHKTGFQGSDELIDRIIRTTIQTGLITALCATLDVGFFLADTSGIHLMFNFPLAKLYSITLLSSLNSRSGWAYDSTRSHSNSRVTGGGAIASRIGSKRYKLNSVYRPEVFINVESHELRDTEGSSSCPTTPTAFPIDVKAYEAESSGI